MVCGEVCDKAEMKDVVGSLSERRLRSVMLDDVKSSFRSSISVRGSPCAAGLRLVAFARASCCVCSASRKTRRVGLCAFKHRVSA